MLKHNRYVGTIGQMFDSNPPRFHTNFYKNMVALTRKFYCGANEDLKEADSPVSWHPVGRNHLVRATEGEWLYQCDTDQAGRPDVLLRLLYQMSKHKVDIVSGLYLNKHPESGHIPVANVFKKDGSLEPLISWQRGTEIMEVANVGAGCLLVKNHVFKKMQREYDCDPFDIAPGLSEDYSFCSRAWKLGIPVYLCPQIEVQHTVTHFLSAKDFGFEK